MKSDMLAPAMEITAAERTAPQITLAVAGDEDRELIYRARHDVYGLELRQHAANGDARLTDALDAWNVYLVAKVEGVLAGFISITPPPLPERERFSRRKGSAGVPPAVFGVPPKTFCSTGCVPIGFVGRSHEPVGGTPTGATGTVAFPFFNRNVPAEGEEEHQYSIDKYFDRQSLPIAFDEGLYEIRLLTVLRKHRGRELATLLMYAAFRWVESHGGRHIVAIGRREIVDLYLRSGLERTGFSTKSGAVGYELLHAEMPAVRAKAEELSEVLERIEAKTDWQLHFPFRKPASCFHGGAFFKAIGERFESLERSGSVINADVLDAWFPPSPRVVAALSAHLPWLLRTSPPTNCEGLIETIAEARGVRPENVLPGGGSSDLIFRAFREWLKPSSRALILDPTYGEYAHVLERVIGCTVDRFAVKREDDYAVDLGRLEEALGKDYDLAVIVNPNSPTGRHVPRAELAKVLSRTPAGTRVWVDETYIEYAGEEQSLERWAAGTENVIVCKSMSKVYALSGARVAYLCAGPHQLEQLRAVTPPWVVSLPGQVAAVNALLDPDYYRARYEETAGLRKDLAIELEKLGWDVLPGIANFLLCHLPAHGPHAATVVRRCGECGLFLRDAALMGSQLGTHTIRIAVKDTMTNRRIISILREVLSSIMDREIVSTLSAAQFSREGVEEGSAEGSVPSKLHCLTPLSDLNSFSLRVSIRMAHVLDNVFSTVR
jgi:histidinol-phosphate/aromatic aminotransferase/cobyric acid decarboxylase-like protein